MVQCGKVPSSNIRKGLVSPHSTMNLDEESFIFLLVVGVAEADKLVLHQAPLLLPRDQLHPDLRVKFH